MNVTNRKTDEFLVWHVGDAFRKVADAQNMSALKLAERAGISDQTVRKIFRTGKGHPDQMDRMAAALGVTLAALYADLPEDLRLQRTTKQIHRRAG